MKARQSKKNTPPPSKSPASESAGLQFWLSHPDADDYFGASFSAKFVILAQVWSGCGTQSDVARRLGCSKQYVSRLAAKARRVFGIGKPPG